MSKKSFIKGAAILAVAGLISKLFGALFRIPLTNLLQQDGLGLYQLAYPTYSFLLIISTAGIPSAISKLVAEKIALNNYREAHRVFILSVRLLLIIGVSIFIVFSLGSRTISRMLGSERAFYSILAISPCLIIVPLLSSFRGYFQGMQYMTPTALSQILEQVGKFFLGLLLAYLYAPKGAEYGAAAAVAGVTMSEGAALVLLMGMYRGKRGEIAQNIRRSPRAMHMESDRSILTRIIRIAFPITIGASIMPLVGLADAMIVVNRLKHIGFREEEATDLYGLLTGSATPLINFPAVLTVALAMSLVPAVTESFTSKDFAGVRNKTSTGIRLTMLLGLPAATGMAILARPICQLLYSSLDEKYINITGELLAVLSIGVLFLTTVQTLTAILQGLNRITVPVMNLAIGAAFKILLTYILTGISGLNVMGAAIGTVVCYGVAAVLDMAAVVRYSRARIPVMDFFVKPAAATALMGACVFFIYRYTFPALGNSKATLLSILTGVIVYVIILLLTGALKKEDLALMPGGNRISSLLKKIGLVRD